MPFPKKVVMVEAGPTGDLTKVEVIRFAEIIDKIEYVVFDAWREAGPLFQELRDKRLYREITPDFNVYCRDKWGMSKRHVNRIIHSTKNAELCESKMSIVGPAGPKTAFKSEVSARPLSNVKHGKMQEVADQLEVIAQVEDLTERIVRDVVAKVCPVKKKDRPERIECEYCGGKGWTSPET